jgi:hypothetical protein
MAAGATNASRARFMDVNAECRNARLSGWRRHGAAKKKKNWKKDPP